MKIFFSAGEPSGDQHAARLIDQLRSRSPEVIVEGFGGPAMKAAGIRLLFELTDLAVMGFLRVVPLLRKFYGLVAQAEAHFDTSPPDAVVLVDFPGFNWWIARAAKRRGIPVYYYLPPQLWGWAPWRIRKVRKWVDHVLCALPFEYDWYRKRGVRCSWVGHPFFDQVAEKPIDQTLIAQMRSGTEGPVVAVLPGSRNHEIDKNWPVMLQVIQNVSRQVPGLRWFVGSYKDSQRERCEQICAEFPGGLPEFRWYVHQTSEVIQAADCCFMVSGSISLELLARSKPGMVLYRVPTIGRFVSRFLMTCRFISLPNLIADRDIMPEFISNGDPQSDIDGMTKQLLSWVSEPETLRQKTEEMRKLSEQVAMSGASGRVAEFLLQATTTRTQEASGDQPLGKVA